ncbi:hypothetical protein [Magnetofaba australis]|uniref:Uncharacterized protein n=1 Tax=Magnetofaba australis IT-1 TaxID=1434232 RepID=A0A1Y2K475_9PROT|nr:hypothetical protein [Magnetofaba australis]OSM04029.1 hypothetical protein MAIT1_03715 [Magnetofaba australis IT-1]
MTASEVSKQDYLNLLEKHGKELIVVDPVAKAAEIQALFLEVVKLVATPSPFNKQTFSKLLIHAAGQFLASDPQAVELFSQPIQRRVFLDEVYEELGVMASPN